MTDTESRPAMAAYHELIATQAHRLALELECLLLDTQDLSVQSKWWASAHAALDLYRWACNEGRELLEQAEAAQPKRPILTDAQLEAMAEQHVTNCYFDTLTFARAVEAWHGIKESNL